MITRVQELCRKLKPVLGRRVDGLWAAYLADSDPGGKADIEQTLELLAGKHLGQSYEPDRAPFPPPSKTSATAGEIEIGTVAYGNRGLYPFRLKASRLKEHILVAGRSGSGKTNLTFVLARNIMKHGIKILAMDWKRGYRDLLTLHPDLRIYTVGRDVAPFRFNPLIPPPGCEPHVWIKLVVDVIANAYLGGEGVISLLVAGLEHLYAAAGAFDTMNPRWPTVQDLLAWLRTVKLKGRAAMWQASAERILLAMIYGEFGAVLHTLDNGHVQHLLDHNVILEMDGLPSSSDRTMFSEALTLYLYRYRLAQGPRRDLTNTLILEEAHNLLLAKQAGAKESVLETSIRMVRQYGLGYVFVDQSASLLSKVAFANSYATLALSQKLRADVQAISGAMNLTEEQRDSLSTLPVGTAVVRLADEHPEPFLVRVPLCPIQEGSISDSQIREQMVAYLAESAPNRAAPMIPPAVPAIPQPDKKGETKMRITETSPPPSPEESTARAGQSIVDPGPGPPRETLSRDAIRFLADVAARPLSTTVSRYQRLNLSRRRGNAIRQDLATAGVIEAVPLATRSGQVMLYQLTDHGRSVCESVGIDPGPPSRESLEHRYWVTRAAEHFDRQGYEISHEYPIPGDGFVDVVAVRPGQRLALEIETGKSDIKANLAKLQGAGFDGIVLLATSASAVSACHKVLEKADLGKDPRVELMTWLDV
ncbi:MAG: ATP-binding protein [Phycisphaerae bacterium]|nr:ATP-binding protein [Phycisphaerae bacterium]